MGTVIKSIYTFGRLKKQNAQVNKKSMLKVMLFLCNTQTLDYFPGGLYLGQESHQQGSERWLFWLLSRFLSCHSLQRVSICIVHSAVLSQIRATGSPGYGLYAVPRIPMVTNPFPIYWRGHFRILLPVVLLEDNPWICTYTYIWKLFEYVCNMLSERNNVEYTSQLIDDDFSVCNGPAWDSWNHLSLCLISNDPKLSTIPGLFQLLLCGELKSHWS